MKRILFASSNRNKFAEVKSILGPSGIEAEFAQLQIDEIQSADLAVVAADKVRKAYAALKEPVLVEDDGLLIEALAGFPGVYSSFVFKTIGNDGVLKLMLDVGNRGAEFVAVMGYHNGRSVRLFSGVTRGAIATQARGNGWGFDPIFVPEGAAGQTYAQLEGRKESLSHRRKALDALVRKIKEA